MRAFRKSDLLGEQKSADVISYAHFKYERKLKSQSAESFMAACKSEQERLKDLAARNRAALAKLDDKPCDTE